MAQQRSAILLSNAVDPVTLEIIRGGLRFSRTGGTVAG